MKQNLKSSIVIKKCVVIESPGLINAMRYILPIVFILFFLVPTVQAQDAFAQVDLSDPDRNKLEWLTYQSVNELREEKNLKDLTWDPLLYKAAKDHADYLIKEKKISHFQTIRNKRTPAQRVKIHGGLTYTITGENIVEVTLGVQSFSAGKIRSTVTYQSSGSTMADQWKNSPGHYRNIISKEYNYTAMAVAYDNSTRRLIAVQVFGFSSVPALQTTPPDYLTSLHKTPLQRLPYHLKAYHPKRKHNKAIKAFQKLEMDRGHLTGKYKTAKKIFKGRRSGIVQEFISLQQFDSASAKFLSIPNRRNGLHALNGDLSKPIYRRELLKYSRQNLPRRYLINTWLIRIPGPPIEFLYPLYANPPDTEHNIFLIKNKQLALFTTPLKIPGKLFDVPFPKLSYKNSFQPLLKNERFSFCDEYDTSAIEIFYDPEEVRLNSAQQQEIQKAFVGRGKIVAINASAFASIEGHTSSNDRLASARMDHFLGFAQPFLDTVTVFPDLVTREQWPLFYEQIKGTKLSHLSNMDVDDIRQYVNANNSDTLITRLLNEQRYFHIQLVWRQEHKIPLSSKDPLELYDSLKTEVLRAEKPKSHLLVAAEKAQLAAYHALSQSNETPTKRLPDVSGLQNFPVFAYHDIVFRYTILQNINSKIFHETLVALSASRNFPIHLRDEMVYNNLVSLYKDYTPEKLSKVIDYENIECLRFRQREFHLKHFKELKCPTNQQDITLQDLDYFALTEIPSLIAMAKRANVSDFPSTALWQYYYLYTIQALYPTIPLDQKIYRLLPEFKKHFHPDDTKLTDEERLKLALFYCAVRKFEIARSLVKPLATRDEPNLKALKLYISLAAPNLEAREITELLIKEYPRLGKTEWCDLIVNPNYLTFLLMEDLRLKEFYGCQCQR